MVDERWDKADRLREELVQWKARRQDQHLHYLANAFAVNQEHRETSYAAREQHAEERAAKAAELREERKLLEESYRIQQVEGKESRKEFVASMQGRSVVLREEEDRPDEGGSTTQVKGPFSAIEMFARMFFGPVHARRTLQQGAGGESDPSRTLSDRGGARSDSAREPHGDVVRV